MTERGLPYRCDELAAKDSSDIVAKYWRDRLQR